MPFFFLSKVSASHVHFRIFCKTRQANRQLLELGLAYLTYLVYWFQGDVKHSFLIVRFSFANLVWFM